MNLIKHSDLILKVTTWSLTLVSWTTLLTSDDYSRYTFSPYSPTLLLICTFWGFLTLWIPVTIYMSWRDEWVIGSDMLFGVNITGTLIFGILMFSNAILWFGWGSFWYPNEDSTSKNTQIKVTNFFMLVSGIVAISDAVLQILQKFRVLRFWK